VPADAGWINATAKTNAPITAKVLRFPMSLLTYS
jgi:hypothetical protein